MTVSHLHLFLWSSSAVLLLLTLIPEASLAQQSYVDNRQLACNVNYTTTLGFVCNAPASSCPSYLTFRSTPTYNTPSSIATLLAADASHITSANNISSPADPLPSDTLLIVPINCSCSADSTYYQHDASYVLRRQGENYFTVANNTFQALTTCQSMEAQNPYNFRQLFPNLRLTVPLRCACPTRNQTTAGFRYLLTYLVRQGDSPDSIAAAFSGAGSDVQSILYANELSPDHLIFFFTPILVPLRIQPTRDNINAATTPLQPPPTPPAAPSGSSGSSKRVFVGIGIGAGVLVLSSSGFLVWFFRRRQSPLPPDKGKSGDTSPLPLIISSCSEGIRGAIDTLTVYKFEELDKATGTFAEANRIGGSSSVFRGWFKGDAAAVKIMKGDVSREIELLRWINHSHIIRLSGFCLHQGITYLVYEYAQNGSLTDWLRPNVKDSDIIISRMLDWKQRVQIAYDVADALNYLHNFTTPPYIHNNLKSTNILLDGNMRAKVANFGLARPLELDDGTVEAAKMTRHVVGTYGYMAPEYIENGLVTPKLDVFALGVVMLELLSGRESILNIEETRKNGQGDQLQLLAQSIEGVLSGDNVRAKLREFMDPRLGGEYPLDLAYSMAELAKSCVVPNLDSRPSASEAFVALSKLLSTSLDWDPSHDHELQHSTSISRSE